MANTTDLMICGNVDADEIQAVNRATGLDLKDIINPELCGGVKIVGMECYATCFRCIPKDNLIKILDKIRYDCDFLFEESVAIIVDCDSYSELNGVYTL